MFGKIVTLLQIHHNDYAWESRKVDRSYYDNLVDEAVKTISEFGDFEWFVSDEPYEGSELQADNLLPF